MIVVAISAIVISRVADVDRTVLARLHQRDDAFHEIRDVGEASRLRAVAKHRDVFVSERLRRERWDRPAVVQPHPRPVC
jgi:hypothetical protein